MSGESRAVSAIDPQVALNLLTAMGSSIAANTARSRSAVTVPLANVLAPRPIQVHAQINPVRDPAVNFNVRIINPDKKRDSQVFVLRSITKKLLSTPKTLITEMQRQFGPQLVPTTHSFPIGYMKGSTKVSVRTAADLSDIWTNVSNGDQVVLWCQGVRQVCHEISDSESENEGPPKKKCRKKR